MKGGDGGPAVVAGDPENSLLIIKQTSEPPHFAQLSAAELELLIEWIQVGAPE